MIRFKNRALDQISVHDFLRYGMNWHGMRGWNRWKILDIFEEKRMRFSCSLIIGWIPERILRFLLIFVAK